MSTKSRNTGKPPLKSVPTAAPGPSRAARRSATARLDALEADVAELKRLLGQASRLIGGMLENQAVAAALPAYEQQLRTQFKATYDQGGLGALIGEPDASQAEQATPQP